MSDSARKRDLAAIEEARGEVDRIDDEIVRLLNQRAEQVCYIGDAKGRLGEPIYQPDREEQVFERVAEANRGPLDDGAIRRLFERVIDEARRLERTVYEDDDNE